MPSNQSLGLTSLPGFPSRPPPKLPEIPNFTPVPRPTIPAFEGTRINAGAEQGIIDRFGTLDEKYKFERQFASEGLKGQLAGLNYRFVMKPDGTLGIESSDQLGIRQRQEVQGAKSAGASRGQLYSSFTDQAIGDSLQRLGKYATEAIAQYSSNVKHINDNYLAEQLDLGGRLQEMFTDDAKWAIQNPPPVPEPPPVAQPPNRVVVPNVAGAGPNGRGGPETLPAGYSIVWTGAAPPNRNTMNARYGNNWSIVVLANGKYAVSARTG